MTADADGGIGHEDGAAGMTQGSDAASCRDCSDLVEPVEHVVGLCRRRRTLSKRLTFLDIEPTRATGVPYVPTPAS